MQEWARVNVHLREVAATDRQVLLRYNDAAAPELEVLVAAEQSCCGPAGVSFTFVRREKEVSVIVREAKPGLPAKTVLQAFAGMRGSPDGGANG